MLPLLIRLLAGRVCKIHLEGACAWLLLLALYFYAAYSCASLCSQSGHRQAVGAFVLFISGQAPWPLVTFAIKVKKAKADSYRSCRW